ncbi:hypothetical protein [Nonomuraea cavernae]|uniref:hypothetical protein n=1 Tax=Nonomuraea cavernae TaxID=2045107 RepID=UPI0033D7D467
MAREGYLVLQQTRMWSQRLREKGFTWDQIAEVIALTHDVSPLRLYRLAHGRTAADVVAVVNDADPAGTAALRVPRLYDFESWPQGGRRPPAPLLAALAKIYQTSARNLVHSTTLASYGQVDHELIDRADFRHSDTNRTATPCRVTMDESAAIHPADTSLVDASACVRLLHATGAEEADVKRRELLFELALVFGGSQALGLLRILTPEEEERLAGVLRDTWRMDEAAVQTFEKLTLQARRADEVSGPATLLPVVNGQRTAVGKLLARESLAPSLRDRLLDTYAQLSQLAGYLAYDMLDYPTAEQPLHDGLRAALDLGDPTLIGYMHYWLGRLAADQHRTAAVFDHAYALQSWAARSPSKLLAPLHQSLVSLAHAANGEAAASARAHESALSSARAPKDNEPAFLHWVSPPAVESRRAALLIQLNHPRGAIAAAERYLTEHDAKFKREHGLVLARYSRALALAKEIPEATARLAEAADITGQHSSARLAAEIAQARTRLEPWATTTYVRRLDETLRSRGLTPAKSARA